MTNSPLINSTLTQIMKAKINLFILLISLTSVFIACDRPECKNTNPVFDKYSPDTREYKAELVKQLETVDNSTLTYWFKDYVESDGQELLYFNIQGEGLCAVIVLHVDDWGKLKELRQMKGDTFRGAEFKNLTFNTQQDSTNIKFLFKDYSRIID